MERKFKVLVNRAGLPPKDTILTLDQLKSYCFSFEIDMWLSAAIIEEIKEEKVAPSIEFQVRGKETKRLYAGDLVFFAKTGQILQAGSIELTEEFINTQESIANLHLFYSENERDNFLDEELYKRVGVSDLDYFFKSLFNDPGTDCGCPDCVEEAKRVKQSISKQNPYKPGSNNYQRGFAPLKEDIQSTVAAKVDRMAQKEFSLNDIKGFIKKSGRYNSSIFARQLEADIIENALLALI